MPGFIELERTERLIKDGAQLVEVLEPEAYESRHLPGAINIPLRDLDDLAPKRLDEKAPVVVYCNDHQ